VGKGKSDIGWDTEKWVVHQEITFENQFVVWQIRFGMGWVWV
jgi:hypothetical protein